MRMNLVSPFTPPPPVPRLDGARAVAVCCRVHVCQYVCLYANSGVREPLWAERANSATLAAQKTICRAPNWGIPDGGQPNPTPSNAYSGDLITAH